MVQNRTCEVTRHAGTERAFSGEYLEQCGGKLHILNRVTGLSSQTATPLLIARFWPHSV